MCIFNISDYCLKKKKKTSSPFMVRKYLTAFGKMLKIILLLISLIMRTVCRNYLKRSKL